jgi:hypothetical protein
VHHGREMKFSWRQREETKPKVQLDEPGPSVPLVHRHRSPGLLEVVTALPSNRRGSVLDLGSAVPENFAFFSERVARMQIVDALRPDEAAEPIDRALKALSGLLPAGASTFDLVLAWDVLDYLSIDRVSAVVELLSQLCRPNARLHLIVSGTGTMPDLPTRYRIIDGENLSYEQTTEELIGAPTRTPALVEKMLEGFRIEHSFVLRHGVHEYVAARKG